MKKGIRAVLTASVFLFVFTTVVIAAGESIPVATWEALHQSIDKSGPFGLNFYSVLLVFLSLWLLLIGSMCHRLEKIPGVQPKKEKAKYIVRVNQE